jgi:cytochrome c553
MCATAYAASVDDKVLMCIGCHGADGNSQSQEYPKLAAQNPKYLMKQLKDFRAGKRHGNTMNSIAETIRPRDIASIASYFASQRRQFSEENRPTTDRKDIGRKIYNRGIPERNVRACISCHGRIARGKAGSVYPLLQAQHKEYLVRELNAFKNGKRHNDAGAVMRSLAKKLSKAEIQAVAEFLASAPSAGVSFQATPGSASPTDSFCAWNRLCREARGRKRAGTWK